mmetsp:Transcript_44447/g.109114  ORF Transcript_44447/g.109114 Transcript_44447/m.109114 type:complete len:333 (-) Transcript_44447:50-1048(-)
MGGEAGAAARRRHGAGRAQLAAGDRRDALVAAPELAAAARGVLHDHAAAPRRAAAARRHAVRRTRCARRVRGARSGRHCAPAARRAALHARRRLRAPRRQARQRHVRERRCARRRAGRLRPHGAAWRSGQRCRGGGHHVVHGARGARRVSVVRRQRRRVVVRRARIRAAERRAAVRGPRRARHRGAHCAAPHLVRRAVARRERRGARLRRAPPRAVARAAPDGRRRAAAPVARLRRRRARHQLPALAVERGQFAQLPALPQRRHGGHRRWRCRRRPWQRGEQQQWPRARLRAAVGAASPRGGLAALAVAAQPAGHHRLVGGRRVDEWRRAAT